MKVKSKTTDWISKAVKKPGAFTRYCQRHGYKGVTEKCIQEALKSKDPKTRARARLAKTFREMNKNK